MYGNVLSSTFPFQLHSYNINVTNTLYVDFSMRACIHAIHKTDTGDQTPLGNASATTNDYFLSILLTWLVGVKLLNCCHGNHHRKLLFPPCCVNHMLLLLLFYCKKCRKICIQTSFQGQLSNQLIVGITSYVIFITQY